VDAPLVLAVQQVDPAVVHEDVRRAPREDAGSGRHALQSDRPLQGGAEEERDVLDEAGLR